MHAKIKKNKDHPTCDRTGSMVIAFNFTFHRGDFASIGLCIKDLHAFSVFWELEKRGCGNSSVIVKSERYLEATSLEDMNSMTNRFFVDSQTG